MINKITIWLAAILTAFFAIGCVGTGDPEEDFVVTRPENIREEVLNANYAGVPEEELPFITVDVGQINNPVISDMVGQFMPEATVIAFTQRQFLKDEFRSSKDIRQVIWLTISHVNPETGEQELDVEQTAGTILGVAATLFPQIAPFLPLVGILPWFARKRSRKHLKNAVKSAAPTDGTIDIAAAISSTAKAFGWTHSTSDPEELEKIASEIKVKEAAANGDLRTFIDALEAKSKVQ